MSMAANAKAKKKADTSPAAGVVERLLAGIRLAETAPPPGARDLAVIRGVNADGLFLVPQEVVLHQVIEALVATRRVFVYGDAVVLDATTDGVNPCLVPLRTGIMVESGAASWLANLVVCEHEHVQFVLPSRVLKVV